MNKKQAGPHRKLRIQAGGQVVLMVLLASALVLTLGLSAARQATLETSIDTDQELLKMAFNAAESGIEYYIKTGETSFTNEGNNGNSTITVESLGGNEKILSSGKIVGLRETEFFWLVDLDKNGNIGSDYYSNHANKIHICSDNQTSIVNFKIDYFYKNVAGVYKVQRGLGVGETVLTTGGAINCYNNFSLLGNSILVAVTPMEINTTISIKGDGNFPIQGEEISSTGSVDKVNNRVTINRAYKLPRFLLEAVVSNGIVTN